MKRPIEFARDSYLICISCDLQFRVNLVWIENWKSGQERCPSCGINCEPENAPRVTVVPDEMALDSGHISSLTWYHSGTYSKWPPLNINPTVVLTAQTREMMGSDQRVAAGLRDSEQVYKSSVRYRTCNGPVASMFDR